MIVLTHHFAAALTATQAQGEAMTKHCNNHGATVADVAHLTAGQVATLELSRIHGDAYPVTARTYEHAGVLYLAGYAIRYRSGEPAQWLVRVIDPAPPKPAATPVMRRSLDGQRHVLHSHDGTRDPWRVINPSARYSGEWLSDAEVADWTPMVITAEGEAPAPAPAARIITAVEIDKAARGSVDPRLVGEAAARQYVPMRAAIRALLAELNIEVEGEQS